jgi:nucleotide-binding universal stress UspA family protein
VLDQARANAAEQELDPDIVLRHGSSAGAEVHQQAQELGVDLIVVGSTVRRVGDHPFLGHTVEHLLAHVTEPTIVVVVLPDTPAAATEEHVDRSES